MADIYGNKTDLAAYLVARGLVMPADADPDDQDAALLVASEWLDGKYGSSFSGQKTGLRSQIREWPRNGATDINAYGFPNTEIPREVLAATYEAAYRQLVTPGVLMKDYTPGKYKRVSVDGAVSVEFAGFSYASEIQTQFATIDLIMAPLLTGYGSGDFSGYSGGSLRV